MKKLFLLANEFPYGTLEPYLETECEYYSGFGKIWIASLQLRDDHAKTKRELPVDAELIPVRYLSRMQYFLRSFYALFDKHFYKELGKLAKTKRLRFSTLVSLVVYLSRSHHEARVIDKRMKKEDKSDLVFYAYRFEYQPYVALLLKKKWKCDAKVICRAHGYDLREERHAGNYIPMREALLDGLDMVYPCSADGVEYLRKRYPKYPDKVDVRYLGTKDYGAGPVPEDGVFRIVSCSGVLKVKRLHRIVDALALIKTGKIEWVHYGDGPLFEELKAYAASKLKDNVTFVFKGNTPNANLMKEYQVTPYSLLLNVSESEGIPVAIMEALSFGIPCIATDVGGTREVLSDSSFSRLLDKDFKDEELAAAVTAYMETGREAYCRQRTAARESWRNMFSAGSNYTAFVKELNAD